MAKTICVSAQLGPFWVSGRLGPLFGSPGAPPESQREALSSPVAHFLEKNSVSHFLGKYREHQQKTLYFSLFSHLGVHIEGDLEIHVGAFSLVLECFLRF